MVHPDVLDKTCEAFIQPQVVPPFHSHQVTKPLQREIQVRDLALSAVSFPGSNTHLLGLLLYSLFSQTSAVHILLLVRVVLRYVAERYRMQKMSKLRTDRSFPLMTFDGYLFLHQNGSV